METQIGQKAVAFLSALVEKPLCYVLKSPDTELYEFGFGEIIEKIDRRGRYKKVATHIVHALCRFKVVIRGNKIRVNRYYEDTPCEMFYAETKCLLGRKVQRIALSDKNDLWIDLDGWWLIIVTFENKEESWRYFNTNTDGPHLVASDTWLEFN